MSLGESTKAVLSLVLIGALVVSAIAWSNDRPDNTAWMLRFASPFVGLCALGAILKLHFRRDAAPDYLHELAGSYFNRDGFCFAITSDATNGVAYLVAYFQNQYEQSCVGKIALRPERGLFSGKAAIEAITIDVQCPAAGFGVLRLPLPVPSDAQGQHVRFEVGACVEYPRGKGRRLRFADGVFLRANSNFGDGFSSAVVLAGAVTGSVVLATPARMTIMLPQHVAESVPLGIPTESRTLWKLSDAPLSIARLV